MSILGKLTLESVPYHEPIIMVTLAVVAMVGLAVAGLITKYNQWGVLWRDWITSIDHKRLGVMYIVLALIMLVRGFADAIMMRTQLAMATNGAPGYLPPEHYDQIFTAHGVIMIIFMAKKETMSSQHIQEIRPGEVEIEINFTVIAVVHCGAGRKVMSSTSTHAM